MQQHASIERLASINDLADAERLKSWCDDKRWKVFIVGFPSEAGHKHL
jgi:hypothetical protein